jgi:hypothetical protein
MKLESVQIDTQAQEEGEWREHPYFDGVTVRVRGSSSEPVEKRRAALLNRQPMRRRVKTGDAWLDGRRIEWLCTAECLLDVKGIDDVTYTADIGREWAIDPRMRRFMEGARELADEIGVRETEAHEEAVSD